MNKEIKSEIARLDNTISHIQDQMIKQLEIIQALQKQVKILASKELNSVDFIPPKYY